MGNLFSRSLIVVLASASTCASAFAFACAAAAAAAPVEASYCCSNTVASLSSVPLFFFFVLLLLLAPRTMKAVRTPAAAQLSSTAKDALDTVELEDSARVWKVSHHKSVGQ